MEGENPRHLMQRAFYLALLEADTRPDADTSGGYDEFNARIRERSEAADALTERAWALLPSGAES